MRTRASNISLLLLLGLVSCVPINQKKVTVSDNSQTVDTTPPTNTSISIDGGAASTTSTSVTLTFSATDATEMYITNTSGCGSGGSWEAYATSKAWSLAQTNGTATVYVKYRDSLLNESACINDTIIQVDDAPTAGTGITFSSLTNNSVTVSWGAASDSFTTTANLQYKLVRASSSNLIDSVAEADAIAGAGLIMDWTANTTQANATGLSDATTYFFAVLVKDEVDNKVLYSPQSTTTLDGIVPTAGTGLSFTSVASTSMTVSWGAASDNVTAQGSLQYKLVKASASADIDTIAEIEAISGADLLVNWGTNTLSHNATGLSEATTYYFSVLVKDSSNNKAIYTVSSQTTPIQTDVWSALQTSSAPSARDGFTSVWTGSKMIIWGGYGSGSYMNSGGVYDPSDNSWVATSLIGAPSARTNHVAVWTGNEMIVWGGSRVNPGIGTEYLNDGAAFNPTTNTWTTLPVLNAPADRAYAEAVWTGTEMIVWSGFNSSSGKLRNGGRYNPSTNTWSSMSSSNSPQAYDEHIAIWSGNKMLTWGVYGSTGSGYLVSGGIYDPDTDSWSVMSSTNSPSGRSLFTGVWTGTEMIIWGGWSGSTYLSNGRAYDPQTDSWTTISSTGAPSGRGGHAAIWTGSKMIVWGGSDAGGDLNTGGVYSRASDSWVATSTTNAPSARRFYYFNPAIWTGSKLLIWGGGPAIDTGGAYVPP